MKQNTRRFLSLVLAFLLIAASATLFACTKKQKETPEEPQSNAENATEKKTEENPPSDENSETGGKNERGEGKTTFLFEVVDKEGKKTEYTIHTDKETVGDALQELGLIEGENGAYGLYVKKVCGILADYDVDQTYWSFYIGGEYAMSGVDTTEIVAGTTYTLKAEKG